MPAPRRLVAPVLTVATLCSAALSSATARGAEVAVRRGGVFGTVSADNGATTARQDDEGSTAASAEASVGGAGASASGSQSFAVGPGGITGTGSYTARLSTYPSPAGREEAFVRLDMEFAAEIEFATTTTWTLSGTLTGSAVQFGDFEVISDDGPFSISRTAPAGSSWELVVYSGVTAAIFRPEHATHDFAGGFDVTLAVGEGVRAAWAERPWGVGLATIDPSVRSPDGDANLDLRVDADDYARIDRGSALGLSGRSNGDFDGDGAIDADDYLLADAEYARQAGGSLSAEFLAGRESQFGPGYVSALMAAVPEPAGAALVAPLIAFAVALCRRGR